MSLTIKNYNFQPNYLSMLQSPVWGGGASYRIVGKYPYHTVICYRTSPRGRVAKIILLCGNLDSLVNIYFAQDSVIHGPAGALKNWFKWQEIQSCHNRSILDTKKSFLVSSHPSVKPINLQQCVNPIQKFPWAYTFRANLVPRFPVNLPPWVI